MSNLKPGPSGRRSVRKRGQAMVEFALVLPIFLIVLSGILDFGFMLYSRMTVINAAREGARAAVMVASTGNEDQVAQAAVTSAVAGTGINTSSVQVTTKCIQANPNTIPPCTWTVYDASSNPSGAESGDFVSVTVTYTYHTFFPLLFGTTMNLSSTVQMVIE